jgi:hypothetical protein
MIHNEMMIDIETKVNNKVIVSQEREKLMLFRRII